MVVTDRLEKVERRLNSAEGTLQELLGAVQIISYPEPIAASLARERNSVSFQQRFFALMDAAEAFLKYTTCFLLAVAAEQGKDISEIRRMLAIKPSLGVWSSAGREALQIIAPDGSAISNSIISALFRSNRKPTAPNRFIFEELVNLRNKERGHGSAQPEGVYENLYFRYHSTINDTLASCLYLKFPLVRIESLDFADRELEYKAIALMGPSPIGYLLTISSDSRLSIGTTCIWDEEHTRLIPLGDLFAYRLCDCGGEHSFFLDEWADGRRAYHSYTANHRIQEQTDREI